MNLSMSMVIKGYKYRIYPNKVQEEQINKTLGCARFVYNQILSKKIILYKEDKKNNLLQGKINCNNYCNRVLKKEYLWLKDVDKFALTNAIYNLDDAYQNFFRKVKQVKEDAGFPKFKSKREYKQSYSTNFTNNNIKVDFENNRVQLPKLKWINAKLHRAFSGKILFATVSKTSSGKYFVSFNIECEHGCAIGNDSAVGIDLGIKNFLVKSDGTIINNSKITYRYEKKLARLQRRFAKKTQGSRNWNKSRIRIARVHEKITNVRKDNINKISSQIINENQIIICEDLNISGMVKNHHLSKSIHDCGWGELTRQLKYKAEWSNKVYHEINRYFPSSQFCNVCGYKNKATKQLNIRFWECPVCKTEHDRDKNASINILKQGLLELEL